MLIHPLHFKRKCNVSSLIEEDVTALNNQYKYDFILHYFMQFNYLVRDTVLDIRHTNITFR